MPPSSIYTCAACGGTFQTTRSDAEVAAEAVELFGEERVAREPMAEVCDLCFHAIMATREGMVN